MTLAALPLAAHHRAFLERLIHACASDNRVIAAFLGGSYATGSADMYSDLDLSIVVSDHAYDAFYAERAGWLSQLGDLQFFKVFGTPTLAFTMYADGTEAEFTIVSPEMLGQITCDPYIVLIDKQALLAGMQFPPATPSTAEQQAALQDQITCFWHDLSHFITALGRGQLWWAYGQLEELRRYCMNLMRLQHNMAGEVCDHEKIDSLLGVAALARLAPSCAVMDRASILHAGHVLLNCYRELAIPLAAAHGLAYAEPLEQILVSRLAELDSQPTSTGASS